MNNAGGNLQFDRAERTGGAEPAAAAGLNCSLCKQPIAGAYYELNGQVTCARCRGQVMAEWNRGSAGGRLVKALGLGALAAAVGAGLYFGIEALTGYEFGLVAVVVGVMVGGAVRKGSRGRGGWRYQLLAMFLTYSAVVATDSSMIARELRKEVQARSDSLHALAAPSLQPTSTAIPASVAASSPAPPAPPAPTKPPIVLALALLVVLAYAAPVMIGIGSPLHLLIAGFALYEAWKLNKAVALRVTGPYQAAPQTAPV